MGQLTVSVSEATEQLNISLSGQIDEDADVDKFPTISSKEVVIDFNAVNAINSCGIREWVRWIKTFPANTKVKFQNCPKEIIDQINMVDGFLPCGGEVLSFYVPYYCEGCDNVTPVLFKAGKDYSNGKVTMPSAVTCNSCKKPMAVDIIESAYFKFLENH